MLTELHLKDFGLADTLSLRPGVGLVAITGETGAGKSLLVQALAFVTGLKAQAEWVRTGALQCEVTAVFEPSRSREFAEWLSDSETALVLRRELAKSGRGRAWINDRPVPVSALKRAGSRLCDLHGQNQHQALLDPTQQAVYLDQFVPEKHTSAYLRVFDQWRQAQSEWQAHRSQLESSLRQKDFWEFQKNEIDKIKPRAGEYEELEARRARLRSAGQRVQLLQLAVSELDGTEDGLVSRLAQLADRLEQGPWSDAERATWLVPLKEALLLLGEAGAALSREGSLQPEEETSLEAIEARLHSLYSLKKKFDGSLERAVSERDRIAENLRFLEQAETTSRQLGHRVQAAREALEKAGAAMVKGRAEAALRLRQALRVPLSDLGLGKDPLSVHQEPLELSEWSEAGPSRVEFMLQANPGEAPKPLAKIASGGELSRLMLGLKSVLPDQEGVETLVFDEIDSGIGGETAVSVAKSLLALARGRQVLVVTHLHQIASRAAGHIEVCKRKRGSRHVPEARVLAGPDRQAALARLLAGVEAEATAPAEASGRIGPK